MSDAFEDVVVRVSQLEAKSRDVSIRELDVFVIAATRIRRESTIGGRHWNAKQDIPLSSNVHMRWSL